VSCGVALKRQMSIDFCGQKDKIFEFDIFYVGSIFNGTVSLHNKHRNILLVVVD
jgi:hypothetical protein